MQLSTRLPFAQMITRWASILNPVLANPMTNMTILEPFALSSGNNTIPHLLQQMQQGWVIIDIDASATVYRSAPFNSTNLILNSSGSANITLGVF